MKFRFVLGLFLFMVLSFSYGQERKKIIEYKKDEVVDLDEISIEGELVAPKKLAIELYNEEGYIVKEIVPSSFDSEMNLDLLEIH